MKVLTIPYCKQLPVEASDVPHVLDTLKESFHPVETVNWKEYPYQPKVAFRMAWCEEGLIIHYRVEEQSVRAHFAEDNGEVWTDSCVECFLRAADSNVYYNLECNCVGTLLLGCGEGRTNRRPTPNEQLARIKRWSSLGREAFEERPMQGTWEVALVVPADLFHDPALPLKAGGTLAANIYKCGDNLTVPHFLSWNPIEVEQPDFHRPDFFGRLFLGM